jgi:hypothetical protein
MSDDLRAEARFDIGRVLRRTLSSIQRNLGVFLLLAVLLVGVPEALISYTMPNNGLDPALGLGRSDWGQWLLAMFVATLGALTLQSALAHGTIMALNGRKAVFGDCLSTGLGHFLAILGITILTTLAVGLGLVMLVVPGVFLMICWMVAVPARVVERGGVIQSMSRSWSLTEQHRGMLLVLLILYVVFMSVAGMLTDGLTSTLAATGLTGRRLGALLISPLVSSATAVIAATGVAAAYFELRMIKEGVVPEELVSVFD